MSEWTWCMKGSLLLRWRRQWVTHHTAAAQSSMKWKHRFAEWKQTRGSCNKTSYFALQCKMMKIVFTMPFFPNKDSCRRSYRLLLHISRPANTCGCVCVSAALSLRSIDPTLCRATHDKTTTPVQCCLSVWMSNIHTESRKRECGLEKQGEGGLNR